MNKNLLTFAAALALLSIPQTMSAQAPSLGSAANFALFSTNGAVSNTGLSHLTGNVGTDNGSSTAFGNVDGVMHDQDLASDNAAADLLLAYNQLNAAIPTFFPASLLGNGQTLEEGVYFISGSASLNGTLNLDAENDPNAVFIIQINGAFSSAAASQVVLLNGALACNVFWKVEGQIELATNTLMKGNMIADNAAIILNSGVQIEGRALTTTGAVTINGSTVRIPLGCGSLELTGPPAPALLSVACYTIFSGNGEVTNSETTFVTGDIGTNVGLTTGFQQSNVTGTIHPSPDVSTAQCSADLGTVYSHLNTLPHDIQLLFPTQVGQNLELTPHTYLLSGATVLTNTIILNAQDNEDAVFVLKINGAFSTSTYAKVELKNGAQAKNVFWKVDGATDISEYSEFKGTIIGNNGAVHLSNGVQLIGRALTTNGAVLTEGITATMTPGCTNLGTGEIEAPAKAVTFYPNPFSSSLSINISAGGNHDLYIYSATGSVVMQKAISQQVTTFDANFPTGIYFYKLIGADGSVASGKLISK
ncbi:MAG TPA: ice-binding family protein [Flavobacterium sp.]